MVLKMLSTLTEHGANDPFVSGEYVLVFEGQQWGCQFLSSIY